LLPTSDSLLEVDATAYIPLKAANQRGWMTPVVSGIAGPAVYSMNRRIQK